MRSLTISCVLAAYERIGFGLGEPLVVFPSHKDESASVSWLPGGPGYEQYEGADLLQVNIYGFKDKWIAIVYPVWVTPCP